MKSVPIAFPCIRAARGLSSAGILLLAALHAETITGVVTNTATGQNLAGARVILQGTGREAVTDNQGSYRFEDVPPGSFTLAVSYTALTSVNVPVQVNPGQVGRQDVGLTSDIYHLSKFVVSGEREGQAQAITLQRLSDGVKSIVSADAYGGLAGNQLNQLIGRLNRLLDRLL